MRESSAATNDEPPVCEKCGERHYGRTHPWRAIKRKRDEQSAATVNDAALNLIEVIETEAFAMFCHPQIMDQALSEIVKAKQKLKLALAAEGVEVDV